MEEKQSLQKGSYGATYVTVHTARSLYVSGAGGAQASDDGEAL